jgi:hypothetical protein
MSSTRPRNIMRNSWSNIPRARCGLTPGARPLTHVSEATSSFDPKFEGGQAGRGRREPHILTAMKLGGQCPARNSTRFPAPSRQGEPFNFSRHVITHTRLSCRHGRTQTASTLREWMRGSIAPTDEFVRVRIPAEKLLRNRGLHIDYLGHVHSVLVPRHWKDAL